MPSDSRLFLSHTTADKPLVEAFENLLSRATGTLSENIFCSSLEGQGVPKGTNFVEHTRQEVKKASAVVALISPAYLDSAFCMAELGAAWALGTNRFPIVVPPNSIDAMNATQLGLVAVKIDDEIALEQLLEDLNRALEIPQPKTGIRRRALADFREKWEQLSGTISGPQRIERKQYEDVVAERDRLKLDLQEADDEARIQEEKIKKLHAAKDRRDVEAIEAEYNNDDIATQLQGFVDSIKEIAIDLGGIPILRHAIMDYYDRAGPIDYSSYSTEFDTAIQYGVYDTDSNTLNWNNEDLVQLDKRLEKLQDFFETIEDISSFDRDIQRGPSDIRFWDCYL